MSKQHTLSLPAAIFININIMLGTGTFINTVILAQHAGAFGGFLYLIAGSLVLPLILCIAKLTAMHKEGNFYNFGATITPFWGFLSSWSYFVGKLASATLSIHVFVMFLKHIFPALTASSFILDSAIIALFVLLNTLNVKTGSKIQYGFVIMKAMPLLFAIVAGLCYSNMINISSPHFIWGGIPIALPLVLFCCLGFEATCSLSRVIENSQRNAPRAIIISFVSVILLSSLYQFVFYASLGTTLAQQASYVNAFPLLINVATPKLFSILNPLFSIAIATSALGGAYGILYSNTWNLYALAEQSHVLFSDKLKQFNKHHIPVWCVVIEGIICIGYLLLTQGAQIPLQYTAALGCITAYSISTVSYFIKTRSTLGMAGVATCVVLLGICLSGFMSTSLTPLILFGAILACGSAMFMTQANGF
jgi:amino acid transporter